jgi:chemotaxis protein histidine kinase CheA
LKSGASGRVAGWGDAKGLALAQRALPSLVGKLATLATIAVAFLLALVGTIYLSLRSPEVKVPEVVGKTFTDAENALADAGLSVRTRARRFSSEVKPDTVLDQTPHAGDTVKKGQTIAIVLSRAEAKEGESSVGVKKEEEKKAENANANANESASSEASNTNNRNENKPKKTANKNKNANANNANANANTAAAKNVNSNLNTNLVGNSAGGAENRAVDEPPAANRNTATPPRNANAPTNTPRNANSNSGGASAPNSNAGRGRTVTNRNANSGARNANRRPPA